MTILRARITAGQKTASMDLLGHIPAMLMCCTAGLQRATDVEHSRALGDAFLVQLCCSLECLHAHPSPGGPESSGHCRREDPGSKECCQAPQRGFETTCNLSFLSHRSQTDQEPGPVPQESWALDGYTSPASRTGDSFSCKGKYPGKDFLCGSRCLDSPLL